MKRFEIITLFPDLFPGTLGVSIFKKSYKKLWDYKVHDLRKFGIGKNKKVDDEVFSNTPGMLIRPDVIGNAMQSIQQVKQFTGKKIFFSPRGKVLNQKMVEEFAKEDEFLFLCGRYEGVDQRAIEHFEFEEISIGNYILSGAEVAVQVFMEAVVRKIPGVIGNKKVFEGETFVNNEISESRYTRPASWDTYDGKKIEVEKILLSGDHEKIKKYQTKLRKGVAE